MAIIQKHEVVSGFYFTVKSSDLGVHMATSPHYETDGLCHQAAVKMIDDIARGGSYIMPVENDAHRQAWKEPPVPLVTHRNEPTHRGGGGLWKD